MLLTGSRQEATVTPTISAWGKQEKSRTPIDKPGVQGVHNTERFWKQEQAFDNLGMHEVPTGSSEETLEATQELGIP